MSVGKNITTNPLNKKIIFNKGHYSYVGFFKHKKDHQNTAYRIFNQDGPLAVLPTPHINNNKSTFIYSSRIKTSFKKINSLIEKNFTKTHGQIFFDKF